MKYLLTLYGDESQMSNRSPEQAQQAMQAWDDYTQEVRDAGAFEGGEGLQPSATATTVALEPSGDHIVTDGPFAETREQLGGFYLLDCADLDEALAWARKIPMPGGKVEVRPVMDYEQAGSSEHSNAGAAQ
ncbi:MAG TPA: YciI family protein [Thermoleophilaceae bacterium]|nr:YciI family protein [Thermoleophilaceae bacterium]